MVYYKPVKITINATSSAGIILDVVVQHHRLPDLIMTNKNSLFTLKFWSSLCYFFGIKHKLFTAFDPQANGKTKRHNSNIEVYLCVFINTEQNNWAKLLSMAKFAYHNAKNASTGHTLFELNCSYHPCMSYKEDIDSCFKLILANELSNKIQKLITICHENLHHTQEVQKQVLNKSTKPRNNTSGDKI